MPTVRRAKPSDAARLAIIAERTFRAAFASSNTRENVEAHCAKAYSEAVHASEILNAQVETFVRDYNVDLVGCAPLRWGRAPPCVVAARPAEIQRIYVDQQWHGKGIAQALTSAMLATARCGNADQV